MSLTGYQTSTNLGAGVLKVFQVIPGQVARIGIAVTNGGDTYELALFHLNGTGVNEASDLLDYDADGDWYDDHGYYGTGERVVTRTLI